MDQAEKDAVPGWCSPPSSHSQDCNAAIFFPAASQTLREAEKLIFKLQFLSFIKEMIDFNK